MLLQSGLDPLFEGTFIGKGYTLLIGPLAPKETILPTRTPLYDEWPLIGGSGGRGGLPSSPIDIRDLLYDLASIIAVPSTILTTAGLFIQVSIIW